MTPGLWQATVARAFAVVVLTLGMLSLPGAGVTAQPLGGFVESATSADVRPLLTPEQVRALLPPRGPFVFPAPYLTRGVRLTNGSDCALGADCVEPIDSARSINNHAGREAMLVVLGLGGQGPTLFSHDKTTGAVTNLGPLFAAGDPLSHTPADGWYFSATRPTTLYLEDGPRLLRFDVIARTFETVLDLDAQAATLGAGRTLVRPHSSDDDRVHSATLADAITGSALGCVAYHEDTAQLSFFPHHGLRYDGCQVDQSGRWLIIRDDLGIDPASAIDTRLVDLTTGAERVLLDRDGGGSTFDAGFGVLLGADPWDAEPSAIRAWSLGDAVLGAGTLVYRDATAASASMRHVRVAHAGDVPLAGHHACGSSASPVNGPRANEIACFMLDGSLRVLVVAPVMADAAAGFDGDGALDVTGRYFVWTGNTGGRRDAFVVEVPMPRLTGAGMTTAAAVPATPPVTVTLSPEDTSLNLDTTNYSADPLLMTYTWPDQRIANAIVMTFDLSAIPAGAVVQSATLELNLVESDAAADPAYTITAHKLVGPKPVIAAATGYTRDGAAGWTPNACCANGVPLAQADIAAAYDARTVDQTLGQTTVWNVTGIVQDWIANPAANAGLLLNSDPSKPRDRYRYFASAEYPDTTRRPILRVTYGDDTAAPSISITAPTAGATVSGAVTVAAAASDNVGVVGVRFQLDGVDLGAERASAPWTIAWNTAAVPNGTHVLTAIARDVAGNTTTSAPVAVTVTNPDRRLTVKTTGTGRGAVRAAPSIDCGTACAAMLPAGTAVTLTAEAGTGSAFAGWRDACSGPAATCTVTMDANKTVTAEFTLASVLSFSAATYSVSEAGPVATITVVRTGGSQGGVTVDVATSDGTARANVDYAPVATTLTFAAGQMSRTFSVPVTNGTLADGNKTVRLALANPTGFAVLGARPSAVLTIVDNDVAGVVQFSAAAYTVNESADGQMTAIVRVVRTGGAAGGVGVDFTMLGRTAQDGTDYVPATQTLTFGPGETSRDIPITILPDTRVEGNETILLTLGNPTGGARLGAPQTAVLTILDAQIGVQFSAPSYRVRENAGSITLTVVRTGPLGGTTTVPYATADGTARAGVDYTPATGVLTFPPGAASRTFTVALRNDTIVNGARALLVVLGAPSGGELGPQSTAVVTIVDDDGGGILRFSAPTYAVSEGAAAATITVVRSAGLASAVTVDYATSDGTATAGADYVATSGTLSFAAGQASATFTLPLLNDAVVEGPETVLLSLSNPTGGATLGTPATAVLTINDDDVGGSLRFSATGYSVTEGGAATITVLRSGGAAAGVTVDYATADGSALGGVDYTPAAGTLTFGAGETSKTFTVQTAPGAGRDRSLTLSIGAPHGGGVLGAPSTARLTIVTATPALEFSAATYTVSEAQAAAAVTVVRSGPTTGTITVRYATVGGTATVPDDYTTTSAVLTFAPGVTSRTVVVPVRNDGVAEPDETILLALSDPTGGAVLGPRSTAQVIIVDDDGPGTLQFSAAAYRAIEGATATITVTRSRGTAGTVFVQYTVADGTATAGADYVATSGVLTFGPGVTSKTFTVRTLDDSRVETERTIMLALGAPTGGATLGVVASAVLTIADNDAGGNLRLSGSSYTVTEGGTLTISVLRSGGAAGPITVDYATTSGGTAAAGVDYTPVSGTLTLAAGQMSATFTLATFGDTIAQGDRTVAVELQNPTGGAALGTPATATVTIVDDEPRLRFGAPVYAVSEGGTATISVLRSGSTAGTVSVDVAPSAPSAALPAADVPPTSTLTFPPGVVSRTLTVSTQHDTDATGAQSMSLALANPVGATLATPATTRLAVADLDAGGTLEFSAAGYSATEADELVTITVTRTGGAASGVTVRYTTSDRSAVAGADYVATSGTLTFDAGETTKTFDVPLITAATAEPTKTIALALSDPTGGATLGAQSTALVYVMGDLDQTPPSVSITSPLAGASVAGRVTITASAFDLVGVAGVQFTVDGAPLGAELTAAPYTIVWDTTGVAPGNHTLAAIARDAAGNVATSAAVTVKLLADTTPPVISGVAVSAVTTSGATIAWTTNEVSDSQVEYGPTITYTAAAPPDATRVTAHRVTLSGLAASSLYHFRVRSRDTAGNLATSGDFTFTTATAPDVTPPVVAIVSPAPGSVAGSVTVSASASDDVKVAGVQLMLDGVALGAELTAPPYATAWNTVAAANGPHTLTAVARDAAGNTATSAAVTVTVSNTDTIAPTVAITDPAAGSTVSGIVSVSATASDNVGVVGVQFRLDGAPLGAEDTSTPHTVPWNTTGVANGPHTLTAVARDAAGNVKTSAGVTVTVANPDVTPPAVAISAPLAGASLSGSVTVSATASDNVGVVGVQFRLDGMPLGAEDTSAPYSVAWNTTTTANGPHTLTAVARDAAGNTTTSAAVSVTVANDTTAPTIAIGAPLAGATLAGSVTVSATASDNVGVVGVQFRVDGAALGAEVTAAPYAIAWNTTAASNGTHSLTAVARDAAGNRTTSAAVAVTVSNGTPPPPPPGSGIAALYPGDAGIEAHPDVVFVERFDESTTAGLFARWTDILNGPGMAFVNDAPAGSPLGRSLDIPWSGGGVSNGGHLYKQLATGVNDTLYVRYYIKYPTSGTYQHSGIWMGGYNPPLAWPNPQAGLLPSGADRFSASGEQNPLTGRFDHYDYWMGMHQSADGNFWGNNLLNSPTVHARTGQWMCVEQMVKLNNPVTANNGEHAIWLDGAQVSHLGPGYPNGTWSGGIFTQNPAGAPFDGFRWRSDPALNLNWLWLQVFASTDPAGFSASMRYSHVVVAKSYVGCLAPAAADTTRPTVSITAPAAAATVSGPAVVVSASASDNVGVVGVQFKLNGANLGAEDTTPPYSVTWDTTQVPSGSYTLTAVARDAAGNTTTSAPVSVTVSNIAPPPGSGWPNEPAGMTLRSDWGFDQDPPTSGDVAIPGGSGWRISSQAAPGSPRGWAARVADPTAPFSPANVYDFVYPQGMVEGNAPATVYYNVSATEMYVGFWWKPSSPFDLGPDGNKIAFMFNGGGGAGGQQFMILMPDGKLHVLPEYPGDFRWRTPNVNSTTVTLGAWHRIEWYATKAGTIKWWLDGVLQGSYTDAPNSFNFDMFQFSPTWGGNIGATKHETDHYWFDHVHLSTR